jgi:hypothetical protein
MFGSVDRGRSRAGRSLAAGVLLASSLPLACGAALEPTREPLRRSVYVPGESIASARLCTCSVCLDRACCEGDRSLASENEPEFGLTLAAPCRCERRVWTARGNDACSTLAGPECCPGSVSD